MTVAVEPTIPFDPPTYPYDRLAPIERVANALAGGVVDLSIGTPCDPPPAAVIKALANSGAERGYPASIGSVRLLDAARDWMARRFDVTVEREQLAACIGTKEFVAGVPQWLRLRYPEKDTVLHPATAYPTYEMGALLAGCRAVAVPSRSDGTLALETVSDEDADRALCLWSNSPSNPTGALDDLLGVATWGRSHGVPVFSDECYCEFTWEGPARSILEYGLEGVVAVHSISKRSNCAGLRVGFFAGDPELVHYLIELRRHAGFMVPGPIQLAGAIALEDDEHVREQRARYRGRLERFSQILGGIGIEAPLPAGGFYLWIKAPADGLGGEIQKGEGPEWGMTRALATRGGVLVSPGEFYGPAGVGHIRVALVAPDDRLELVAERLE
jgi:succinyldiaminopimelate transaminase